MREDQRPYWLPARYPSIAALVNDHGGNVSAAARAVGVDRLTITRWLDHEQVERVALFVSVELTSLIREDPQGAVDALARWATGAQSRVQI